MYVSISCIQSIYLFDIYIYIICIEAGVVGIEERILDLYRRVVTEVDPSLILTESPVMAERISELIAARGWTTNAYERLGGATIQAAVDVVSKYVFGSCREHREDLLHLPTEVGAIAESLGRAAVVKMTGRRELTPISDILRWRRLVDIVTPVYGRALYCAVSAPPGTEKPLNRAITFCRNVHGANLVFDAPVIGVHTVTRGTSTVEVTTYADIITIQSHGLSMTEKSAEASINRELRAACLKYGGFIAPGCLQGVCFANMTPSSEGLPWNQPCNMSGADDHPQYGDFWPRHICFPWVKMNIYSWRVYKLLSKMGWVSYLLEINIWKWWHTRWWAAALLAWVAHTPLSYVHTTYPQQMELSIVVLYCWFHYVDASPQVPGVFFKGAKCTSFLVRNLQFWDFGKEKNSVERWVLGVWAEARSSNIGKGRSIQF